MQALSYSKPALYGLRISALVVLLGVAGVSRIFFGKSSSKSSFSFFFQTVAYTFATAGSFLKWDVLTPWLIATLVDFYANVGFLYAWIFYKEVTFRSQFSSTSSKYFLL